MAADSGGDRTVGGGLEGGGIKGSGIKSGGIKLRIPVSLLYLRK